MGAEGARYTNFCLFPTPILYESTPEFEKAAATEAV